MIDKPKPTARPRASTSVKKPAAAKPTVREPEKVTPVVADAKIEKTEKSRKLKMVRDSFTMPQDEYANIAALKARCLKAGVGAKKSELLRAALACLAGLSDQALLETLAGLKKIKTGRPKA